MKQLSRVTAGRVGSRYSLGSHSGARLFAQFLPQRLARTVELSSLSSDEQRILNQVSAHEYLRPHNRRRIHPPVPAWSCAWGGERRRLRTPRAAQL